MTRDQIRAAIQATQDSNVPIVESGEMSSEDDPIAYILATAIDTAEDRADIEISIDHALHELNRAKLALNEKWEGSEVIDDGDSDDVFGCPICGHETPCAEGFPPSCPNCHESTDSANWESTKTTAEGAD